MTPQRQKQIEETVIQALELSGAARADYLDSACGADSDLRREVESLLAQENRAAAFLEIPAFESAAHALATGDSAILSGRIVGPYRVDALLGAGGMGEVYRAWDTRLRRAVALKFLAREFLGDTDAVDRFQREARAASALGHPNICTVYDIGEGDGRPFIAMEYLEGCTLRAKLDGAALPPKQALVYTVQIAKGLAAAHQKGIVHRDVKPENLWVTPEDHIKILDFGLAKVPEPLANPEAGAPPSESVDRGSERVMGTVGYMSPEQVRGEPLDHRSDIFSLGAILHEMITGERAFRGDSSIGTLIAILNTEPPQIADPALNPIVRRCLEKDITKRFPLTTDLVNSLERALVQLAARPQPLSRRRALQAGGVVAAAAGIFSFWKFTPGLWPQGRWRTWLPGGGPRFTRIAVLPLANLSGDTDQEYFADGMTDLLITDLGQISSLRVIARPSVMQFKGSKTSLKEIARQLGVEALIVGSVQSSGTHVRITAQLVDPNTNQQLWTASYNREVTDVLALQGDVARAIVTEIQARVTDDEGSRLASKHKVVPAALDAYLLGKFYWDQFTEDGILKALDYYE